MKLKLVLFFASVMMFLSSCTVYVGPNGLPFGAGFQPVRVGVNTPFGCVTNSPGHPRNFPSWNQEFAPRNVFGGNGCIPQPAPCRTSPRGAPWQYPRNYQGSHDIRPGCAGPGGPFGPPVVFY